MIMAAMRLSAMLISLSLSLLDGGGRSSSMSACVNSIVSTVTKSCQSMTARASSSSFFSAFLTLSLARWPSSHRARLRDSASVFHLASGSASVRIISSIWPGEGCMTFWYDSTMRL